MKSLLFFLVAASTIASGAPTVVKEWVFDSPKAVEGWSKKVNHVADVRFEDGALVGTIMDWDPWLTGPKEEFKTNQWHYVEVEMKTDLPGRGELFFTDTDDTQYDGFYSDKHTLFQVNADNEWHTYVIRPYWQFPTILKLRLDFATTHDKELHGKKGFAVRSIRVMDPGYDKLPKSDGNFDFAGKSCGWEANADSTASVSAEGLRVTAPAGKFAGAQVGPINVPLDEIGFWVVAEVSAKGSTRGKLSWLTSVSQGERSRVFDIEDDGRRHWYNIDLSGQRTWAGNLCQLGVGLSGSDGGEFTLHRLYVSDEPGGPPSIFIKNAGLPNAINRVGQECDFAMLVTNLGGETARGLKVSSVSLPPGAELVPGSMTFSSGVDIDPFQTLEFSMKIRASRPVKGEFTLVLSSEGGLKFEQAGELEITASLGLPKADYVPEPQPLESDYEVGALYFPGWDNRANGGWQRVYNRCPERKPVLGWYDEGNPECVDWQIKWLVENGMTYLLVDWYWSKGQIGLDHWIKAFKQARYRKYMKWAMMWANHNAPGSHSLEDMKTVAQFWVDNYFNMPEYYTFDGKPVVMMWSVYNMDNDMRGKGGAKALIEAANEVAVAAGYKGIHFSAMKWPEDVVTTPQIQALADKGFESTSIYHYMSHGGKAKDPRRFSFELVAETNKDLWEKWYEVGILPFFTNLSTGWDDRPWNDHLEIYGRTPELFKKICQDAKAFADRTGLKKRILLSPLNEWGEGSYAEPNREYGFGMYEAVREVFCKKPAGGWPLNYGPTDVGLGPYDVQINKSSRKDMRTSWDLEQPSPGWGPMMGIKDYKCENGIIAFTSASFDPALTCSLAHLRSNRFKKLIVRMKVSPHPNGEEDTCQLFWGTSSVPKHNEPMSVSTKYRANGQFQDIVLDFTANSRFTGFLTSFRFDPITRAEAQIEIDSIRLE